MPSRARRDGAARGRGRRRRRRARHGARGEAAGAGHRRSASSASSRSSCCRRRAASMPKLPIFLLGDREGELPDEDAAATVGATRLFLRPIDVDSLADAIEKRAVEAEVAEDVAEAMREFDVRPPTIDAAPLVEEAIVEMEADYGADDAGGAAAGRWPRCALERVPTEVDEGRHRGAGVDAARRGADAERSRRGDVRDGRRRADARPAGRERAAADEARRRASRRASVGAPPASRLRVDAAARRPSRVEPLMRADDALGDVGMQQLAGDAGLRAPKTPRPPQATAPTTRAAAPPSTSARTFATPSSRANCRRPSGGCFPIRRRRSARGRDEYEDALGDIDLDSLGIDTIPGIGADALDAAFDLKPRNGHATAAAARPSRRGRRREHRWPPSAAPIGDAARRRRRSRRRPTWRRCSRRCTRPASPAPLISQRGDGDKTLYFDAGMPVAARSTLRARSPGRPAVARGQSSAASSMRARAIWRRGGRGAAQKLVELRAHQVERAVRDAAPPRRGDPLLLLRLGARPLSAVARASRRRRIACGSARIRGRSFVEGVRRKYGLERLVELRRPARDGADADDAVGARARRRRVRRRPSGRAPSSSTASARWRELALGAVGAPLGEARAVRARRGRSSPSARRDSATPRRSEPASACARCRRW